MPNVPKPPGIEIDPPSVDFTPTVLTGGMTVTVNEQLEALLLASFAVHFTVMVPSGKFEPDGGEQLTVTADTVSEAVGLKLTIAPNAES